MLRFCPRPSFVRPLPQFRTFVTRPSWVTKEDTPSAQREINDLVTAAEELAPKEPPKSASAFPEVYDPWVPNTAYDPRDFDKQIRLRTYSQRARPLVGPGATESAYNDAFRQLNINPLREVNNPKLFESFMTGMGKIRPRVETGLSWRSQRMVTRAIKRAKHKGVIPMLSRGRSVSV
ncbi:hypothetical protein M422DRAFT_260029 [Sphaerobolus stellatus SS14]|uniref:Small ribosomal subunit protein bS18m n=1 Tax=Sphaerobolus stellatus (strain SS14) TaxID=990650 RepID=A0A0C9U3F1_SPHS4|nr:hypothetical protein M422DRAFT_260029 [Sphaerobolus stellatus SS14]